MNLIILLVQGSLIWSIGMCQWAAPPKCGQNSRLKRNVLEQPTHLPEVCSYTIEAYNEQVCQLLIQFEVFKLQQPLLQETKLACEDRLSVDGFEFCGVNTGQHLYVAFPASTGSNHQRQITLSFNLPNRWAGTQWRLVVTQLECPHTMELWRLSRLPGFGFLQNIEDTTRNIFPPPTFGDLEHLAPPGCQQYYTQPTGNIKSFNFNATIGTLYLPKMKYAICIKSLMDTKKIDYNFRKFSLAMVHTAFAGFDIDCHATAFTMGRPADSLMIPQAVLTDVPGATPTYFCGRSLQGHQVSGEYAFLLPLKYISTSSSPFVIYFESDDMADPVETGFSIDYMVKSA